jgi:hypothetical protein
VDNKTQAIFISKNVWFAYRIRMNNTIIHIKQQQHFIDLSQLTEFMMRRESQWTDEENNSTVDLIQKIESKKSLTHQNAYGSKYVEYLFKHTCIIIIQNTYLHT